MYTHTEPFASGYLKVGDLHTLYYEQYGNPQGKPVIFLHGGPGSGTSPANAGFFDPTLFSIALLDQRGAGKSLPFAELRANTSPDLVADIEALRTHLQIPKWHLVFGGSWGSTLALLYAQAHPSRVGSLIVRGIFTGRKAEMEYTFAPDAAVAKLFPEAFEAFVNFLPPGEREGDLLAAYHRRLNDEDPEVSVPAVRAWNAYEETLMGLEDPDETEAANDPVQDRKAVQVARIECHYFINRLFVEEGQILRPESMKRIAHIPGIIIHGRLDMVCPPETALLLHRAWPKSKLYMIPRAGHLAKEPGIQAKLLEACDEFAKLDL